MEANAARMNPKKRERRRFKEKNNVGPVLNHFSREVGALGLMRSGGAGVETELSGGGSGTERWMDEGLLRRHKVRLQLETAAWSQQNHAEPLDLRTSAIPRKARFKAAKRDAPEPECVDGSNLTIKGYFS